MIPAIAISSGAIYLYGVFHNDDGYLWFEILSDLTDDHPFQIELSEGGDENAFGCCRYSMASIEEWMIANGIAPEQEFLFSWKVHYFRSWTDGGYEYDADISCSIIWVEQWPVSRIADAWADSLALDR
jgi:hypothetical protein